METKERKTTTEKCIVFDFDELQCLSIDRSESIDELNPETAFHNEKTIANRHNLYRICFPDIKYEENIIMWGMIRPGLYDFLKFCFQHFRVVAVWSAGEHDYVHACITSVWGKYASPHIIYTARDCEYQCLDCSSFHPSRREECPCGGEIRMVKPLRKFWDHPKWGKYMTPENTLIIDDRNSVFRKCNPGNGIQLPKFEPAVCIESFNDYKDDTFERLIEFFKEEEFVEAEDIRDVHLQIFKTEEVRMDD